MRGPGRHCARGNMCSIEVREAERLLRSFAQRAAQGAVTTHLATRIATYKSKVADAIEHRDRHFAECQRCANAEEAP